MLEVPVYNIEGKKIDTVKIEDSVFGLTVNVDLVKQAVVAYQANRRQGTACGKGRGEVSGSTRKLFRQKGTGYARRGNIRTHVLKGGGMAFAKKPRDFGKTLPKKMRRAALRSAILAKILGEDLLVVDGLNADQPKTRTMVNVLKNLGIERSCLLTLAERDRNLYLSGRNIPGIKVQIVEELNAFDIAVSQKMLVTAEAMKKLVSVKPATVQEAKA